MKKRTKFIVHNIEKVINGQKPETIIDPTLKYAVKKILMNKTYVWVKLAYRGRAEEEAKEVYEESHEHIQEG